MAIFGGVRGQKQLLQSGVTTGSGDVVEVPVSSVEHVFMIQGASGVTAGAIQVENASDSAYSGTWAPIGSPITVVGGSEVVFAYTGVLHAVRARISTNISGGGSPSVTVNYKTA